MDLGAFLADDSIGGSWADEEVDMSSIGVSVNSTAAPVSSYSRSEQQEEYPRRERQEFPVPDAPPFKARVANLPYEVSEEALSRFFEDRLQARDIVEDVKLPMDQMSGRPKGFAFVTFTEKAALEEALQLTMSEFSGRKIYVNVAAPQKTDPFDLDWRGSRTGPVGAPRRDEQPDLDWGAARSAGPSGRDRERRPRREEVDLDWGSARSGAPLPARERRPRREEAELDWNAAASNGPLPPREYKPKREEPQLDWGSARSGAPLPARERRTDGEWSSRGAKKPADKEFDWKRGQTLAPRAKKVVAAPKADDAPKPQKSLYDVLSLDASEDEAEEAQEKKADAPVEALEKEVASLSVEDGWKTVGK